MVGAARPKGNSLHIGLNRVDPIHYTGWKGELVACESDARDMETIARSQGFVAQSLLTKAATSTAVLAAVETAAKELVEDDFFVLTYSGHGGQINDVNKEESDGLDDTWVLYDRALLDDELYAASIRATTGPNLRPRFLPPEVQSKVYKERASVYDDIRKKTPPRERVNVECSVILLSACQDNQIAMEGNKNGLFTETLLRAWDNGRFNGSYHHFRNEIASLMPPTRSPKYTITGHRERAFEHQRPFAISMRRAAAAA